MTFPHLLKIIFSTLLLVFIQPAYGGEEEIDPAVFRGIIKSFEGNWSGSIKYRNGQDGEFVTAPTKFYVTLKSGDAVAAVDAVYEMPGGNNFLSHDDYGYNKRTKQFTATYNGANGGSILKWNIEKLEAPDANKNWKIVGYTTDAFGGKLSDLRITYSLYNDQLSIWQTVRPTNSDEDFQLTSEITLMRI